MGVTRMDEFLDDEKLKRAISMTVINIGELIKSITEETRKLHLEIPWKAAAGMRDIAAHKYQTLRMEDVYYICQIFILGEITQNIKNMMLLKTKIESLKNLYSVFQI